MKKKLLEHQYKYRREPSMYADLEIAIIILKPGFTLRQAEEVEHFISLRGLKLLHETTFQFDTKSTLALYNDIFRFNDEDTVFGYQWKDQKMMYMSSGKSHVYVIQGRNAQAQAESFKYTLRDAYGKLSVPDKKLSSIEFNERAIKNIIHVVDSHETEIALRLFF